ncbi:hypothetical protein AVEN_25953-1 [Araneus ventricosus]|uniref:Uncharacterized protein n=1 Tax=Araneus ventricosus TaxID=182803 RepID=A0A4Y2K880_ARAVE|nr:hypothetical protein AVEN_25953-1 [Araneus ventricosus]
MRNIYCYKHGKSLPSNVSLMIGKREFYRGEYGIASSNHVWFPDIGDKFGDFGDEIWDLKGARIFSIFPLGEEIHQNIGENSMGCHDLSERVYKDLTCMRWGVLIHWERL